MFKLGESKKKKKAILHWIYVNYFQNFFQSKIFCDLENIHEQKKIFMFKVDT